MNKNLVLIIKANQEFIRHNAEDAKLNAPVLNTLFENISDLYIPLLNMLETFSVEKDTKISMVIPPVLCNLLTDEAIKAQYVEYLVKNTEVGKKELIRNKGNSEVEKLINAKIEKNEQLKKDFEEKYNQNLIKAFLNCKKEGKLELLATCGTDLFIPHYSDIKEIISAQIECGLYSYREAFGEIPEGFWIPELGYFPGLENLIKAFGFSYTVLDARAILFSTQLHSKGIFYPARTDNSLVIFGADPEFNDLVFGEEGYCRNSVYRNENRDIGFELEMEQLSTFIEPDSVRYSTGYKYFNNDSQDSECSDEDFYNPEEAAVQISKDAEAFVAYAKNKLVKAEECLADSDFVNMVCYFDSTTIKSNWSEFAAWFAKVVETAEKEELKITGCNTLLENQYSLEKITPYYSACGDGYGDEFLSSKTSWMMRYNKKACERIVDLSDRFQNDTGLKTRLLNLGAKELLMAQSTGLIKMITSGDNPEFAERRFIESINAFTSVFDSLGSNTVSTEWLTTLEDRDCIFPWMNYRIFSKKK